MRRKAGIIAALAAAAAFAAGAALAQSAADNLTQSSSQVEREKKESGYGQVVEEQRSSYDIPKLEKAIDPDLYVLGPYDRLLVNVMGAESRTFAMVVLPVPNEAIRPDGAAAKD